MHWTLFDYASLRKIKFQRGQGRRDIGTINNVIIAADTETSKKANSTQNHVVAWSIAIRYDKVNIASLYGSSPIDFCECIKLIKNSLLGELVYIYFHNLNYDWAFLRKFLIKDFGEPINMLATGPHYPIEITFDNGIILKDSLILASRNLDKWAEDLDVEHKKACGKWDYKKIRNQNGNFTDDEIEYITNDTLSLVECIDKMCEILNKKLWQLPKTATGIPRAEVRKLGAENKGHAEFLKRALTYEQYEKCGRVYHGGYAHANRHYVENTLRGDTYCYDFASSYPYCLLAYKFPMTSFMRLKDKSIDEILRNSESSAYMFKLILVKPILKDYLNGMPYLQKSKCFKVLNPIMDDSRILSADYVEIYTNEIDLEIINNQYDYEGAICTEVEYAAKDYLPRWLTDYIFELFKRKCELKDGDQVLYKLAKQVLNSIYGMMCQKPLQDVNKEDYATGNFYIWEPESPETRYSRYTKNRTQVLNYQWGVWTTSYASRNLFALGNCAGDWYYSDTDSVYGDNWDLERLNQYNESCKERLRANGYDAVVIGEKEYWLGIAELEKHYTEFRMLGAKRYCGRDEEGLKITVAGVPKSGYKCLNDNIENFKSDFVFTADITGKLTTSYIFIDKIYEDENGNLTGDSIDLTDCDYRLDAYSLEELMKLENTLYDGVVDFEY